MHTACYHGYLHIASWLVVSQGHSVSATDGGRSQPLHWAVVGGHVPVITWLIANGADPHALNSKQQPPLHLAELLGNEDAAELLRTTGGKEGH